MDLTHDMMLQHERSPRWYSVQTYTGYEQQVQVSLEEQIVSLGQPDLIDQVRIPITQAERFPGYVLVHMRLNDTIWALVRSTAGVKKGAQPQLYNGLTPG